MLSAQEQAKHLPPLSPDALGSCTKPQWRPKAMWGLPVATGKSSSHHPPAESARRKSGMKALASSLPLAKPASKESGEETQQFRWPPSTVVVTRELSARVHAATH